MQTHKSIKLKNNPHKINKYIPINKIGSNHMAILFIYTKAKVESSNCSQRQDVHHTIWLKFVSELTPF
jgi:hypothetical protein